MSTLDAPGDRPRFPPVEELVPHAAPMLTLREVVEWEPGRARVTAVLTREHYFMRRGTTDACVALELISQAVAACLGLEALRSGESVRTGMIVGCRRLSIERGAIAPGELVTLDVRRLRGSDDASQFEGSARDASGARIASGTFTLVHPEQLAP